MGTTYAGSDTLQWLHTVCAGRTECCWTTVAMVTAAMQTDVVVLQALTSYWLQLKDVLLVHPAA